MLTIILQSYFATAVVAFTAIFYIVGVWVGITPTCRNGDFEIVISSYVANVTLTPSPYMFP